VGPIFNENFVKKEVCRSYEQCTDPLEKQKNASTCSKKRKGKR